MAMLDCIAVAAAVVVAVARVDSIVVSPLHSRVAMVVVQQVAAIASAGAAAAVAAVCYHHSLNCTVAVAAVADVAVVADALDSFATDCRPLN